MDNTTKATTREQVEAIDWKEEIMPNGHPMGFHVTSTQITDVRTGGVVCRLDPNKYRFYWTHSHLHIAPADWNGVDVLEVYNEKQESSGSSHPAGNP